MELLPIIQSLAELVASGQIEIYNEVSIQHELAILLRQQLDSAFRVQLERNVSYFNVENKDNEPFLKKEMDIIVFDTAQKEKHCIELKYPLNGQVPVQMFKACEDVRFLEQLTSSGFDKSYFVLFAEDPTFYSNMGDSGIYRSFRKDKLIKDLILGTTGPVRDQRLCFNGKYRIEWKTVKNAMKYFVIEVTPYSNNVSKSKRGL